MGQQREVGLDYMVELAEHLRRARLKRWKGKSDEEKKATASRAGKAFWSKLSPEERSAEMKRRAAKRELRRSKASDK